MVTWCLKVTSRLTATLLVIYFWNFFFQCKKEPQSIILKKVLQITLSEIASISLKMMKVLIKRIKRLLVPLEYCACNIIKVLFTDHCRWQNFGPSLLRLVDRLYKLIHKMQKTRKKLFCDGQSE